MHPRARILRETTLAILLVLGAGSFAFASEPAGHWPQFRGAQGSATLDGRGLPDRWSKTENVVWAIEVPGRGWSSPIVWGDQVFLTTATTERTFKEPTAGIFGNGTIAQMIKDGKTPQEAMEYVSHRDNETPEEAGRVTRMVLAYDLESGDLGWRSEAFAGPPPGGRHRKNTYASETPVTDGERVYALFGNVGVIAYDLRGREVWRHALPARKVYLDFGTGASPALDEDNLYVQSDNDEESYLLALDKRIGTERWRVTRSQGPNQSGWSTPFVWRHSERDALGEAASTRQIVTTGPGRAIAYDPAGREIWRFQGLSHINSPMPFEHQGLLVLSSGSTSEPRRVLAAIRPSARGDISLREGEKSSEHVAWVEPRGGTYIPTPVAYGDRLYALYDKGFLAAYEITTGRRKFKARIGRGGNTFSSSPWAYDGKIFALSETGETFVFEAGDEYRLLHTNELDELTLATPALTASGLFVRTDRHLYRIATEAAATSSPAH